jgi:hypothetical protein
VVVNSAAATRSANFADARAGGNFADVMLIVSTAEAVTSANSVAVTAAESFVVGSLADATLATVIFADVGMTIASFANVAFAIGNFADAMTSVTSADATTAGAAWSVAHAEASPRDRIAIGAEIAMASSATAHVNAMVSNAIGAAGTNVMRGRSVARAKETVASKGSNEFC